MDKARFDALLGAAVFLLLFAVVMLVELARLRREVRAAYQRVRQAVSVARAAEQQLAAAAERRTGLVWWAQGEPDGSGQTGADRRAEGPVSGVGS